MSQVCPYLWNKTGALLWSSIVFKNYGIDSFDEMTATIEFIINTSGNSIFDLVEYIKELEENDSSEGEGKIQKG
jgi:hypothetical protein